MTYMELTKEKLLSLKEVLKDTKKLFVLTHDNPDPDGISSAATLASIVTQSLRIPTNIRYCGIIGRAENREMIRLLGLKLKLFSNKEIQPKDAVALVDCQPYTGNVTLPKGLKPLIIIDHHPLKKAGSSVFLDNRVEYGATATILGEYLLESGLEVTSQLATALCYGISSETQRLGREAHQQDVKIYSELFSMASKKRLSKIEHPILSNSYFMTLNRALHQSYIYKNAVVTYLGEVTEPDFIPLIADMLLRRERISWSLAMGRHENKILISLRTTRKKANAGMFLRKLIGKKGTGGGHGMVAGGQVSCDAMAEGDCNSLEKELAGNFLKKLGYKEPGEMTPLLIETKPNE